MRPSFDEVLLSLAGLVTVPWAVHMADNSRFQLLNASGDPHAEAEHWAVSALLAVTISVCAVLGSTDHRGWQLPAWIAAAASVIFGVHSVVFADLPSALTPLWAAAAIVWGGGVRRFNSSTITPADNPPVTPPQTPRTVPTGPPVTPPGRGR